LPLLLCRIEQIRRVMMLTIEIDIGSITTKIVME